MLTMKVICCVLFLVTCGVLGASKLKWNELDPSYTFDQYLHHYGKSYHDNEEYEMRKTIFSNNLRDILVHNQDGTKTWKEEINHFADWTEEEFAALRGYKKSVGYERRSLQTAKPKVIENVKDLPTSVDWRTQGVVTPVRDQGQCGSCWSFASTETLESHWALKHPGQLWDLSEQQILDCTSNPLSCGGTGGCGGGTVEVAYTSIMKAGGLSTEWTYSYQSYSGTNFPSCKLPVNFTAYVNLSSFVELPSNQYAPLLNAVGTIGPVAVSVDARSWRFYSSGVFNGCNQTNPDLDHAVVAVGYGTENGTDYWLIRNSWTPMWGDNGYIKILRTENDPCGTDTSPQDGDGCGNGPASITVCGTCGVLYDNVYPVI